MDLITLAKEIKKIPLHGIIANAGVGGENYRGKNDRWHEIIDTNLTGTYNTVNAFLPNLENREGDFRHIVIISSVLARLGVSNYTAYCASKAGLLGLMRSWAIEFAPEKILVNAICPGWVSTEMAQSGMKQLAKNLAVTEQEFYSIAMESVPLKKMSEPIEIAQLIHYLLSQRSITGQTIDINNGSIMNS
jgi:NAD(P)-dependent dehydrogenase (short-subunit alcohol dehydrogenase family)